MGKIYYCDYCDRSFKDELRARKQHLSGTFHIRKKAEYNKRFRGIDQFISDELGKPECRRYLTTGSCDFGVNCIKSHYSRAYLNQLKQKTKEAKKTPIESVPTLESWLEKRDIEKNAYYMLNANPKYKEVFSLPAELAYRNILPPSFLIKMNNIIDRNSKSFLEIKKMMPRLSEDLILSCLQHYKNDVGSTVRGILQNKLPPNLQEKLDEHHRNSYDPQKYKDKMEAELLKNKKKRNTNDSSSSEDETNYHGEKSGYDDIEGVVLEDDDESEETFCDVADEGVNLYEGMCEPDEWVPVKTTATEPGRNFGNK